MVVAAPRESCTAVLLDVERYPEWYDTLDEVAILRRDDAGRPAGVAIVAEAGPLGALRIELALAYELPEAITATRSGGDARIAGWRSRWELRADGPDATRVSYALEATAGDRATAVALRVAGALVRRGLVDAFPEALRRRVENG